MNVGPYFKLIFLTVASLTALSLLIMCIVAMSGVDSDSSANLLDAVSTTFKMGFGAIIGLIGGKAAA